MPLVAAKCTQCGANIEVDNTKEAGICKFCGTAFITEKAINNYIINNTYNIQSASLIIPPKNIGNLKKLGNEEYQKGNYDKAYEYFSKVLEISEDNECVFKRKIIDQLGNSSELVYTDFPKILKPYYESINMSEMSYEEKLSAIQSACEDCYDVISKFYYKKRNQCITVGKIINNSYVTFLLACRDSVWAIKHLVDFEFTIINDYKEIENLILSQCDFAILVLDSQTKRYGTNNSSYGCYTLTGDFADQCYENASIIAGYKNKITQYSLPDNLISPNNGGKGIKINGCYIATCVYGSYDCPQVWTLRRFRDCTLDETWYGRLFIRCYYAISPILVKWLGEAAWFRTFWKANLDKLVADLNSKGVEDTYYNDKY
ncbi:tetratricopeptide repeat protein [Lachnospiraceae bacterium 62-35]